jgi:hypothetical protein
MGCNAVWLLEEPTFRKNVGPPSSKVTRIGEVGTTLAVTSNRSKQCASYCCVPSAPIHIMMEVIRFSEKSVLTRATRRNIPEDAILHSQRRKNLKSYICTLLLFHYIFIYV